jgi:hypothetical protein
MKKSREKIQWKNQFVNLVAVILGVYIAFALNDWQVNKSLSKKRHEAILSLKDELLKDKEELTKGLGEIDTLTLKIKGLFRYSEMDSTAADSMNYFMGGILTQQVFNPNNFTFQSLINTGDMGGLSDITFRRDILELYNGHYNTIKDLDGIGMKNFQEYIIAAVVQQGGRFDDAFIRSPSFKATIGVIQDLLNSRRKAYKASLELIEKIVAQIEKGSI